MRKTEIPRWRELAGDTYIIERKGLVAAGYDDAVLGRLAAHHVHALGLLEVKRHAADSGLRFLLDLGLGLGRSVPVAKEEASVLDTLLELLVVVALVDVSVPVLAGFLVEANLYVVQHGA